LDIYNQKITLEETMVREKKEQLIKDKKMQALQAQQLSSAKGPPATFVNPAQNVDAAESVPRPKEPAADQDEITVPQDMYE
jgi:hypothetical protein